MKDEKNCDYYVGPFRHFAGVHYDKLLPAEEPVIAGRALSEWALLYARSSKNPPVSRAEAAEVIKKYGQTGAPFFATMINARDTFWSTNVIPWAQRQHWYPIRLQTVREERMLGLCALSLLGTNSAPALEQLAAFKYTNSVEQVFFNQALGRMAAVPSSRPQHSDGVSHSLPRRSYVFTRPSRRVRHYVVAACWENTSVPPSSLGQFPSIFSPKLTLHGFDASHASDLHLALYNTNALLDWFEIWWGWDATDLVLANLNSQTNSGFAIKLAPEVTGIGRKYYLDVFTSTTNCSLTLSDTNSTLYLGIKDDKFIFTDTTFLQEKK